MKMRILKTGLLGVLLLAAALGVGYFPYQHSATSPAMIVAAQASAGLDQSPLRASFADAIDRATRSVVSISSSRTVKVGNQADAFRRFFGDLMPGYPDLPSDRIERGLGSGVIIDSSGLVVTNHHVVENASEITVTIHSGKTVEAKLIGRDSKSDLALLKIEAEGLEALPLGDSSSLRVGDLVFAIGNPFGVGQTVTMGIVSATGRGGLGIEDYEDFIQTDAAINPGNSGGALIDSNGRLVGINTAILARSGGNEGIGFAIPADMVAHNVDQLRRYGRVNRGLLGAVIQDLTPALAEAMGASDTRGVLISGVTPGGPAEKSGIQRGDVVVALNGKEVPDARRLRLWIGDTEPGTTVTLSLLRNGRTLEKQVKLAAAEPDAAPESAPEVREGDRYGFSVQELTPQLRERLGVTEPGGVLVSQVSPRTPAEEAGLRQGDVILEADRQPVSSADQLRAILSRSSKDVLLLVSRGGQTIFLVLQHS